MVLLTYYSETAAALMLQGTNIYLEGLLFGIFLTALNLFTFFMYVRLLAYSESQWQTQILQEQLDAYARRITTIEAFQRQAGEMRHEFKNLLITLKADLDHQNVESANNRVRVLLGDLKQVESEHYTGNTLIDAIISYKAEQLRELGANFLVQADLLDADVEGSLESPAAYDIASVMGIALDNVVDAVAALKASASTETPASPEASVDCQIQIQKNMLMIRLSNPLPGPLRYKDGEIQSTKALSGHGLGLPALRRIVRKYEGEITISDRDGIFCLSVMLFLYK
jgi:sensor histidine kinase regulating citrate/malate metabolism